MAHKHTVSFSLYPLVTKGLFSREEGLLILHEHLLTKLAGKKSVSYFVAEVIKDLGGGELEVKYCKRCGDTNKFILDKEDIYITDSDTIERKLPAPVTTGQSERQAYQISFQVDFNAYNVH